MCYEIYHQRSGKTFHGIVYDQDNGYHQVVYVFKNTLNWGKEIVVSESWIVKERPDFMEEYPEYFI